MAALALLAGQEIQTLTLYCLVPGSPSQVPDNSQLFAGLWAGVSVPGCEASAAGPGLMSALVTQRHTGQGGGRQCSVYLGPQSGGQLFRDTLMVSSRTLMNMDMDRPVV